MGYLECLTIIGRVPIVSDLRRWAFFRVSLLIMRDALRVSMR